MRQTYIIVFYADWWTSGKQHQSIDVTKTRRTKKKKNRIEPGTRDGREKKTTNELTLQQASENIERELLPWHQFSNIIIINPNEYGTECEKWLYVWCSARIDRTVCVSISTLSAPSTKL